jgi:hypothetical protein
MPATPVSMAMCARNGASLARGPMTTTGTRSAVLVSSLAKLAAVPATSTAAIPLAAELLASARAPGTYRG